ncbi:MAG: pyridoxamine 5'-phosphate oxidase family protein [Archaeoglobaceae archaeon]|nr:pyridoxamine 5'-phosphate oxidase family protein [Archaeoglobaceae archaeon]MDW8118053.1 pyridoxamine 5'-phosphate oxidase family protein [Archaeoglobaceae archaeon]
MIEVEKLSPDKIEEVLKSTLQGVMSFLDGDKPYSVPMLHIFLDGKIYFAFPKEGRKQKCLENNKNVCYVVVFQDCSLIIEGSLEKVREKEEIRRVLPIFCKMEGIPEKICEEFIRISITHPKIGLYLLKPKVSSGWKLKRRN